MSSKLAILEKIARGEITVQQGTRFLTQIETPQQHCCNCYCRRECFSFELGSTATIPTEELEQLVATKIAIRNDQQMRRIGPNLVESQPSGIAHEGSRTSIVMYQRSKK